MRWGPDNRLYISIGNPGERALALPAAAAPAHQQSPCRCSLPSSFAAGMHPLIAPAPHQTPDSSCHGNPRPLAQLAASCWRALSHAPASSGPTGRASRACARRGRTAGEDGTLSTFAEKSAAGFEFGSLYALDVQTGKWELLATGKHGAGGGMPGDTRSHWPAAAAPAIADVCAPAPATALVTCASAAAGCRCAQHHGLGLAARQRPAVLHGEWAGRGERARPPQLPAARLQQGSGRVESVGRALRAPCTAHPLGVVVTGPTALLPHTCVVRTHAPCSAPSCPPNTLPPKQPPRVPRLQLGDAVPDDTLACLGVAGEFFGFPACLTTGSGSWSKRTAGVR